MSGFPRSPSGMVGGLRYFGRMLDKIRLLARGELNSDYHANLGHPKAADGRICNFLRVDYERLRQRVLEGGSDEELLEWCYQNGRGVKRRTFSFGIISAPSSAGTIVRRQRWSGGRRSWVFPIAPTFKPWAICSTTRKGGGSRTGDQCEVRSRFNGFACACAQLFSRRGNDLLSGVAVQPNVPDAIAPRAMQPGAVRA